MPTPTSDLPPAFRLAPPPAISAAPAVLPAAPRSGAGPEAAHSASANAGTAAASNAGVAVAAVVKLVDAQADRAQEPVSAVSLNFKFGADDLAVRVEWHNGEVHTQFRTDSPELRDAIAGQWQAALPAASDRSVSFAAPVFSSGGDASSHADGGGNARGQGYSELFDQPAGNRAPRAARAASESPAKGAAITPLSSVLRLHTFA